MSDETSVYIDALSKFGTQLYLHEAGNVGTGLAGSMTAISSAVVGVVGTDEAQTFAAWNAGMLEAFSYFTKDVGLGYASLGGVAIIMASNYRQGDLSQAEAMGDVLDAFNPPAGSATVADVLNAQPPEVKQPQSPSTSIPLNDQCKAYTQYAKPNTPQAKWQDHENRYKQWESWRPTEPDPSAQPKPTPPAPTSKPTPPSNATPSPSPQTSPTSPPKPHPKHSSTAPPERYWCPAD